MENLNSKKKINKIQKTILYFFLYAFLGWVGEELLAIVYSHVFIKRGFLFGPICPIYGYGALILIFFFNNYKNKPVKLFCLSAIVFTVFEYVTDFFLQALFGIKWWDYTGMFLNLNGRVTLSFSILWGIGGLIFIRYLHPFVTKIIGKILAKIPFQIKNIAPYLFVILMFIDTIVSSLRYLILPFQFLS